MKKIVLIIFISLISVFIIGYEALQLYIFMRAEKNIKKTLVSEHWQMKVKEFRTDPVVNNATIFFGNSLTENFDVSVFNDSKVINRGINGDFTSGLLLRLDEIIRHKPAKVFIEIGINDIIERVKFSTICQNYRLIIERLKSALPNVKIYIQSNLPTMNLRANVTVLELNENLVEIAKIYDVTFIDLHSGLIDGNSIKPEYTLDGIHLTSAGYKVWYDRVRKFVEE